MTLPTRDFILWSGSLIDKTWVLIKLTTSWERGGLFFEIKYSLESLITCSTTFGNNVKLYLQEKKQAIHIKIN